MSKIAEVLIECRDLISEESRWNRGVFARDRAGFARIAADPDAVSWCALGAVMAVALEDEEASRGAINALNEVASKYFFGTTAVFVNDAMEHADVLKMYDLAIGASMEWA